MQIQVDIGFEQLVKIAKRLPENQWAKLKEEVEKENVAFNDSSDLEVLLLSAPTFDINQLDEIEKTRKAISQWRKKYFLLILPFLLIYFEKRTKVIPNFSH